ncbi:hypothetical protein BU16DRAFT_595446 [Lophium mytilinum]|uniref:Uncharacterized protein n=1 Tax=Lophium mytilinum TaxID=390894 RepID=A0A6A6QEM4_9PEZI|nr:hypothetical protein BU16DRAFT_595446 [Lophium mytilinum]
MYKSNCVLLVALIVAVLYAALLVVLEYRARQTAQDRQRIAPARRYFRRSLKWLPAISVVLSIALVVVVAIQRRTSTIECSENELQINPDIGGIGVLLGLFLSCLCLLLVLLSGHFEAKTSGAKELCIAQLANLSYLSFNLMKSVSILNYGEVLVACSSIDAVGASVSMALSDKDVLAARKLGYASFGLQFLSLVVEGIGLRHLGHFEHASCTARMWHPTFNHLPHVLLWMYLAVRIVSVLVLAPTIWRLIRPLNELENARADGLHTQKAKNWALLPATLFSNYWAFVSFIIPQAAAVFMISAVKKSFRELWTEWGQSASLIVAVAAILHVLYSFFRLYGRDAEDHRVEVAKACTGHRGWKTAGRTRWSFYQRHPFEKLALHPSDELLVDDSLLRPFDDLRRNLSEDQKKSLLDDLFKSFELNDRTGITDCLERGAPVDRPDDYEEYPIHKAARFGDMAILKCTILFKLLLKENKAWKPHSKLLF